MKVTYLKTHCNGETETETVTAVVVVVDNEPLETWFPKSMIGERKIPEETMQRLAFIDPSTGSHIETLVAIVANQRITVQVFWIDLPSDFEDDRPTVHFISRFVVYKVNIEPQSVRDFSSYLAQSAMAHKESIPRDDV